MTIEGLFQKVYTYVLKNYVGVTTESTPIRESLPQASPSDVNAIWLAPNGNDLNIGTEAAPVLTLGQAISLLTAAKTTVNIFRNGYVGTIEFAISGALSLPIDRNIQCESGQVAILYTDTVGDKLTMFARSAISGLHFEERGGVLTDFMLDVDDTGSAAGNVWAADNCTFERKVADSGNLNQILFLSGSANISYEITACNFIGPYMIVVSFDSVAGDIIINNCAFTRPPLFFDNPANTGLEYAIFILFQDTNGGRKSTFTWSNLIFYGFNNVLDLFPAVATSTGVQQTLLFDGVDFSQCQNLAQKTESAIPPNRFAQLSVERSRPGYVTVLQNVAVGGGFNFTVDVTVANNVDQNLPSLYVDEAAGSVGTSTGFQLQRIGKPINGKTYAIDSPLIGVGPSTFDVSAWEESAVLASQGWNDSFTMEWKAESYSMASNRMNPSSIADVNGNIHTDDDGIRKTYTLDFGSGATYASNNDLRKLVNAVADRGSLKFLPRDGDNLFTDSITCDTVDNGDATMTVTPSLGSGNPMIQRNWAGFWATINGLDFYILSNTATTMVVIDKIGNAFPVDGTYSFEVTHILVKSNQNDIVGLQSRFTDFICGAAIREGADDETTAFELQGYSIKLDEVEDPEEAT